MVLEYEFLGRDKLVKGHTYPIKRGDLDAALERAEVSELQFVSFSCNPKHLGQELFLSAGMLREASQSGVWSRTFPDITIIAIPIAVSQRIKECIEEKDLLNHFACWLKDLEEAENVRRMKDQFYTASLIGGKLVVEHT
ncbi:hypothetical protein [Pseudodesulfovibrio methanolicus]|uniref:Uncharacterized protein n=1 Tax=Pseudodesulfovibrio methanolicus TaxID=3126690 RepID=A0ABZ2J1T8_9BACT